jgi:hypothetical protein
MHGSRTGIVQIFESGEGFGEQVTHLVEGAGTALQCADTLIGARHVVLRECPAHLVIAPAGGGFGHSGGGERVLQVPGCARCSLGDTAQFCGQGAHRVRIDMKRLAHIRLPCGIHDLPVTSCPAAPERERGAVPVAAADMVVEHVAAAAPGCRNKLQKSFISVDDLDRNLESLCTWHVSKRPLCTRCTTNYRRGDVRRWIVFST